MKNEIAIVKEDKTIINSVAGNLFEDIKLKSLDTAIEKIARHTGELTPDERHSAAEVINMFKHEVVSLAEAKARRLNNAVYTIEAPINDYQRIFSHREFFLAISSKVSEDMPTRFTDLCAKYDAIKEYEFENKPEPPICNPQLETGSSIKRKTLDYELKEANYVSAVNRKYFALKKDTAKFLHDLQHSAEIIKFKKILRQEAEQSDVLEKIVNEKAAMARLTILVSSEGIREAIQSLHELTNQF